MNETLAPAIAESAPISMLSLIRESMLSEKSPEYLRELLAVRRDWESDEARKAFHLAKSEFQRRAPIIPKADAGEKSKYAKLDRIWRTIRPLLTELGLSVTWQISELRDGTLCHLEGALSHKLGHSEKIVFDIPVPDVIRNKEGRAVTNVAQQMGSAHSYAQRYATCSALGVICGDDDDGQAAGTVFVNSDQAHEIDDLVAAARGVGDFSEKEPTFWKWCGAVSSSEVTAGQYMDVIKFLKSKISGK